MTDTTTFRDILKDEQHPLNRAAWMLFSEKMNLKYAQEALKPQQDEVIAFCNHILDDRSLYEKDAFGKGNAPLHAVELLCAWKNETALPRLLNILEHEKWDTMVYGTTADAIAAYGSVLIDPLLEMATRKTADQEQVAIAGTLAEAAPGDARVIDFVRKTFNSRKEAFEIGYMAENVLIADPENGVAWLKAHVQTQKYSKEARGRIDRAIANRLAGKF